MARPRSARRSGESNGTSRKRPIEQYDHSDKTRVNNPPVGLVTPETDRDGRRKRYAYDPHLDPTLHWAGKAERLSFEVPTVSLHVHERIDAKTVMDAVRQRNGSKGPVQRSLFEASDENPPLRDALDFYRHPHSWSNRLIAGDSLLVMNSLLEKEGMAGKVQMVYIDPPYGIRYGSNFQPFVNKRDVKDGSDEDLTAEPEMIRAFRDTWELGIHSYLGYLRDRLLLAHELLTDSGSCFVQISDDNVHNVRNLMDEVFGRNNFVACVNFQTMTPLESGHLENVFDYMLWFARDSQKLKYRNLFLAKSLTTGNEFRFVDVPGGGHRESRNRLFVLGTKLYFKLYYGDFPFSSMINSWPDTVAGFTEGKVYVVQTQPKVVQRCLLMSTDPGDLVFDPTCGSGTTAYVAEQWGRRWITCDTSRVAVTLAKQRLMTAVYDYYELAHPGEGVGSGFVYKTVPHVTLKSVANDETAVQETLYDQTRLDNSRVRVTGPFTVEAVPAPTVRPLQEANDTPAGDVSVARSGETLRQSEWRAELLKTGIRGKNGQMMLFSRVEPLAGTRWLHADAEVQPNDRGASHVRELSTSATRAVLSFGPEFNPLEQRQVELAWEEARTLSPRPALLVFAAFQFDPEASKDIDELTVEKTGMTFLKVQMNPDLLTDDLKKKRASNESFWLIGQPDVELKTLKKGDDKGKFQVEVHGFDYYNTRTGQIESGDTAQIAVWMLDTDYDGRSLYPRQVFFPMAGEDGGWARLARSLRAELDEERIEAYRGTVSLPFEAGKNRRVAVKIVDDRGIESLRILGIGG